MKKCKIVGCDRRDHIAHGLCNKHYLSAKKRGDLPKKTPMTLNDRMNKYSKINPTTGCIEWVGYRNEHGYGRISIGERMVLAHRVAWETTNGPIPEELRVLHKCDNPQCVNPEHLFLGTQADNIADMNIKGRQVSPKGEKSGVAKLTEENIRKIRADDRILAKVAKDYGVTLSAISKIKNRISWSHVE